MSKKTKITIIIIAVVTALAIVGVSIFFIVRNNLINKTVGTTWGDTYYMYLKEAKTATDKTEYGMSSESESVSLEFFQYKNEEDPVMVISYQKEDAEYSNIYYINNEGEVEYSAYEQAVSLEFLYNIEEEKYSWYVHIIEEDIQKYQSLKNIVEISLGETTETDEVSFSEEELVRNEDNMNLSEFDETFIETGISSEKVDIDFNSNNLEFRDLVENAVNSYKSDEEITTEEVQQITSTKLEEINQKQEELKVQEELEKAKITSSNVNNRIGSNLKWFSAAYLGSTYGWGYVYDYEDVSGEVSIPDVDEFMTVYEVVGAESIENMKNTLAEYMSSDVITRLSSNSNFDYGFEEYDGKVYWVTGGVGDGDYIDYDKAEVISSDGVTSEILLKVYNAIGNTKTENITITVTYENGVYMITDYSSESAY